MRGGLLFCSLWLFFSSCLPGVGPLVDSGVTDKTDSGSVGSACASAVDCQSGVCEAMQCVPPASVCAVGFANCSTPEDLTAPDAGRVIRFPSGGDRYNPGCIRVRLGQTVSFKGDNFNSHPMEQSCGPVAGLLTSSSGQNFNVTFDRSIGTFGFYCRAHGTQSGSGMAGAIEVVP